MNVNNEKLFNVEKKNNLKFILKIVGMVCYWLVFLVCFITLLCAVLVPKSDNKDNIEESSSTIAHAETLEQIEAETKYYLKIPAGTVFDSPQSLSIIATIFPGQLVISPSNGIKPYVFWFNVIDSDFINDFSNELNLYNALVVYFDDEFGGFTVVNDFYICCDYSASTFINLDALLLNLINITDEIIEQVPFISTINSLQVVEVQSGGGTGEGFTQADLDEAYNQGTDGVITTDYGFDTLYWNTAKSNQYVDSVLSLLTYQTDGSNYAHYYAYVSAVSGNFLDIVINTTNNTYLIYLASSNTGNNRVELYNSSVGWIVDNPLVKSSFLAVTVTDLLSTYEVPSVGTFTVGEQNNLLVDLFSTVPFYSSYEFITFGDVRYTNGYNVGVSDQITLNPISTFLEPIQVFFDTKFFGGISIGVIFSIVIFVAVALIFIKMFAGG